MESDWHVVSITLLDELVRNHLGTPTHYFCGGNMFIYYSVEQAEEIEQYVETETPKRKPRFKGPDFFLVKDVDGTKPRESWVVWNEDGRYPDLVVEFISSSTRKKDVECGTKTDGIPTWWWSLSPVPRAGRMWKRTRSFTRRCFVCLSIFGLTVARASCAAIGCRVGLCADRAE